MSDAERRRDPVLEENERLSFVILQHVYSLDEGDLDEPALLLVSRVAAELALDAQRVVELVAHLTYAGFVSWEGTGRPIRITPKGSEYIERLAHRRRSIRLVPEEVRVPEEVQVIG